MSELQIFIGANTMFFSVSCFTVIGIIFLGLIFYSYSSSKKKDVFDDLVLEERQQNKNGYTSNIDKKKFLGAIGVCMTDLRPSGTIQIEGEPVDVVTEGNFIKKGDIVKVINVDSSRVLVRQI